MLLKDSLKFFCVIKGEKIIYYEVLFMIGGSDVDKNMKK